MIGAELVAKALQDLGVRHVFAIVSIHNMPILDAINRLGSTKIIDVRHEQAGTHAADGYARASGDFGVMIASTGPGTTNTVTGLYEASYSSSRVLVITGQAETAYYGKGLGYVHEAENQPATLATVCKRVESPREATAVGVALQMVVSEMFTGRGGPAAIEIPIDLQYAEVPDARFARPSVASLEDRVCALDESTIDRIVSCLGESSRRVIVAGGGVLASGAESALRALAEKLDCPVATTVSGRGVLPENDARCLGNFYNSAGMYQMLQEADVTLAVGTRFAVGVDGQFERQKPGGKLIQIDIDGAMVGRTHAAHIGCQADALVALTAINERIDAGSANDGQFNEAVYEGRDGVRAGMRRRLGEDWPQVMDYIRERMPDDGLFVRDQTISAYNWANQLFPILEPRTSMNPVSGAIGPGFPMSLGACVASERKTVVVHGDGGFMFHATELATAAQYQLPLIVLVFNDSGYGVLRWLQDRRFGRVNETDLGKVDFGMMARSMGVSGSRVASVTEFKEAFDQALDADGPVLIDIDMEHFDPMEISVMPKRRDG